MGKIGLILEGGGMRGMFTTGVLDYFIDANIKFDQVMGVSAGACQGSCYMSWQKERGKNIVMEFIHDKRYCSLYNLLTTGDLFSEKFAYHTIPNELNIFDYHRYLSSRMKFIAVSTNVETGEAHYPLIEDMRKDVEELRASASLPFVSRNVMLDGDPHLDGGIADPLPFRKSETMGYSKNVVVLTQPLGYRKKPSKSYLLGKFVYRKYPKFVEALKNRHVIYNQCLDELDEEAALGNVLIICPKDNLGLKRIEKNKDKLLQAYHLGYERAKEHFLELEKFANEKKSD